MTRFELLSIILSLATAIGAGIFCAWQIKINARMAALDDFVAVAITPNPDPFIKLLNTGKSNLYIYGYSINSTTRVFKRARLIPAGTLDASYYWIPVDLIPPSGEFDIIIYLEDEFGEKYVTEGGGEVVKIDEQTNKAKLWTYKTIRSDWTAKLQPLQGLF